MNFIFILFVMVWSFVSRAEEGHFEMSLAAWPPLSTSDSQYGGAARLDGSIGYFFNKNVELQLGSILGMRTRGTSEKLSGIYAGALYNFSEDPRRSFVVGGGVGYVNHYPLVIYSPEDPSSSYFYVRAGKRFLLSEDYLITYFPYIELMHGSRTGDRHLGGQINLFNFSLLF